MYIKLDDEQVRNLTQECLIESETDEHALTVQGVVSTYLFDPVKITENREQIKQWLSELPHTFRKDEGGGWSFLYACKNAAGQQWTSLHVVMESLFCLGIAAGFVSCPLPRDMWNILPGGMPYYTVDLNA